MRPLTCLSVSLVLLLAACSQTPTVTSPTATQPAVSIHTLGTLDLSVGPTVDGQALSSTIVAGMTVTKGATSIYEDGFFRYVSTEYMVKNTSAISRSNVTLLAIGTTTTIPGSPFKAFKLGDGSIIDTATNPALASTVAAEIRPIHGAIQSGSVITPDAGVTRASFQAYEEVDVVSLNGVSGISNAFPWGFVATKSDGSRVLAPNQTANLTLSARVPKSRNVTAFNMSVAVVTDSELRTTRDLLERATESSESLTITRATRLSAANGGAPVTVAVLPSDFAITSCASCTVISISDARMMGTLSAASARLLDRNFGRTQVVRTGDTAPSGGTYSTPSNPSVNGAGQVAFVSALSGGTSTSGLFTGTPGALSAVALQGQTAPGTGGTSTYNSFTTNVALNSAGQVFFASNLAGGTSTSGLFMGTPGIASAVALQGQTAPGAGTAKYNSFGSGIAFNAAGQVMFQSSLTGGTSASGLFMGTPSALSAVALQGQTAPGAGTAKYNNFSSTPTLNSAGQVMFQSNLTGGTSTSGLFMGTPEALSAVALQGQTAPGAGTAKYNTFSSTPTLNSAGQVMFQSNLTGGTSTSGLFIGTPGAVVDLALQGQTAPGVGTARYSSFGSTPALNSAGQAMFQSSLTGGTSSSGLFMGTPGAVSVVSFQGMPAPEIPGVVFGTVPTSFALDASGQVAFMATLQGLGVTSSNNQALYYGAPGNLRILVRKGDMIDTDPRAEIEVLKTVTTINSTLLGSGDQDGRPSGLGADGTFGVRLTFTDSTSSVYTLH